jgi:hypothetical protein
MLAHAAIGKMFDIPVVMTTSAETGPNGHLPREILDMYPDEQVIQRKGEIKYVAADPTRSSGPLQSSRKGSSVLTCVAGQCMGQPRGARRGARDREEAAHHRRHRHGRVHGVSSAVAPRRRVRWGSSPAAALLAHAESSRAAGTPSSQT